MVSEILKQFCFLLQKQLLAGLEQNRWCKLSVDRPAIVYGYRGNSIAWYNNCYIAKIDLNSVSFFAAKKLLFLFLQFIIIV